MTRRLTIAAVALASGTFGGTVGALAASAVQSQASPAAIASAVQKVSDTSAEQNLHSIDVELGTIVRDLDPNRGEVFQLASGLGSDFRTIHADLAGVSHNVKQICINTSPSSMGFILCNGG